MRCRGQLSILFNSSGGKEKIMHSLDHSHCQPLITAQFRQPIIIWINIKTLKTRNEPCFQSIRGRPHSQWHHKFARQVKDSYILLTSDLRSQNQGFAVHSILYTLLSFKIRKPTEMFGIFCSNISSFAGATVAVAAKTDFLPPRQPCHCVCCNIF
jgi:hypothetical protein